MKRLLIFLLVLTAGIVFAGGKTDATQQSAAEQAGTLETPAAGQEDAVQAQWNRGDMPPDFQGQGGMFPQGSGTLPVNTSKDNVSSRSIIDDKEDTVNTVVFKTTVKIDLSNKTSDADGSIVSVVFTDNGAEISSTGKENVKLILSGTLYGTVSVEKAESNVALVLNTVNITAKDGPALSSASKYKTYLVLEKGSVNVLKDSQNREKNTKKGALYSKGALILSGSGTLSVDASYKNGIYSDDYIKITGGTISVLVSARDAVRSINGFIMTDGKLSIKGTGTAVDEESKGIKVDGEENEKRAGEGFIVINGGEISIETAGKAVTAAWEKDEDAATEVTTDDPDSYVTISGGTISIKTTGKPYEYDNEDGVTVSCSPEGIEAKTDLLISGGTITITTADDCLNAGISIHISGGNLTVTSTENDAVDSNGSLTISGGTITAQGGRSPETAFDSDMYPFTITGGTLIGIGGTNMSYPAESDSSQNTIIIFSQLSSGKKLRIVDSSSKEIFSADIPSWFGSAVISSPVFQKGKQYTIYSGDTKIESFTIENSTTTIGQNSEQGFGGGPGGFQGGRVMNPPQGDQNFKGGRKGMNPPSDGQGLPQNQGEKPAMNNL